MRNCKYGKSGAKNLMFLSFLMVSWANILGQQLPVFSNFSSGDYYRNPAALLIPKFDDFQIFYSNSATGFEDAPVTYMVGYSHLFKTNSYTGPSYSLTNQYVATAKNAIGGYLIYDRYGFMEQIAAQANYAQSFKIDRYSVMIMGLSMGIFNYNIDFSKLTVKDKSDQTYTQYLNQRENFTFFDANFGLIYRYKNYKAELSLKQFLRDNAILSNQEFYGDLYSTVFGAASAKFKLSNDFDYYPELFYTRTGNLPYWIGTKQHFVYNDRWLGGVMYNHSRNAGIELGMIYQQFVIQYAFMLNVGQFNVLGMTNHGIVLRYSLNPRKDGRFEDYF